MDPILRRSSVLYLTHLLTYSVCWAGVWLGDSWPAFDVIPLFMPVWAVSSVVFSEREEAYAFLRTLPVTDRAVVRIKFGLILVMAAVYWFLMTGAVLARWSDATAGPVTLVFLTLVCVYALLLAAACQIAVWRFGVSVTTPVVIVYMLLNLVVAIVQTASARHQAWPVLSRLAGVDWLAASPWLSHVVLIALALAAYYGLMQVGVRVKTRSEACL